MRVLLFWLLFLTLIVSCVLLFNSRPIMSLAIISTVLVLLSTAGE